VLIALFNDAVLIGEVIGCSETRVNYPLQAYKYQPSEERDIGRPRRRWRERQH
jgi:hypothetical protein